MARAHIPMHCLVFPVRSYDNRSKNNNQMLSLQSNTMAELNSEENCSNDIFEKTAKFLQDGCRCQLSCKGGPCSEQFSIETVLVNLNNCLELTSGELDLVILANIQAFTHIDYVGEKRNRSPRCSFHFQGRQICKDMFLHLYGVGYNRFRRLKDHYEQHGICQRTHGNSNRVPDNATQYSTIDDVHAFIQNYVEENAIILPGRIPGFKSDDVKMLSTSESKMSVWRVYNSACENSNKHAVSYKKFRQLWHEFYPDVVVAKPMTDLCRTCQQNTTTLQRAANLSESAKSECIAAQQEHLDNAKAEREFYKVTCTKAKETLETLGPDALQNRENRTASSLAASVHYSFDYAQQVHIPSNPMQPGPIYFKTPRKCGIFGVMCKGISQQVNFLIDEAASTGKGANATISYVHYYLEHYGLGETNAHFHADNCAGQNKNNYFMWYFAWRTLVQLHQSITYSFLIAGHTKFAPDRCFGLIKKCYKVSHVSSLYEFARLVDTSSSVGLNKAQIVGTHDGKTIVPVYDWVSFLGQFFKKIPNMKKFHHFTFSKESPGMVSCKESVSFPHQPFRLLKNPTVVPPLAAFPTTVEPEGLTDERKRYLYRVIRQFCKPGAEDIVAPAP